MINKKLIIQALIENDHINEFWVWRLTTKHKVENLSESLKAYNDYVNKVYKRLDLNKEEIIVIIKHMYGTLEAFINENSFIGNYAIFGECQEQYHTIDYVEFLEEKDVCDECYCEHGACNCKDLDNE